jgi:hypothetical protein
VWGDEQSINWNEPREGCVKYIQVCVQIYSVWLIHYAENIFHFKCNAITFLIKVIVECDSFSWIMAETCLFPQLMAD